MDEVRKNEKVFVDRLPVDKQFISIFGLRDTFFRTYNFDSKDGEKTTLKAFHTAKTASIIATWMSSYDILAISHCKTIPTVFARWGAYAGPAVVSGTTYALAVSAMSSLRNGKSDWLNHSVAGVAAGATIGALKQNTVLGARCSFYFGLAFGLYSECRRHGVMMMDARPNKEFGYGFNHYSRQFGMPAEKMPLPENY